MTYQKGCSEFLLHPASAALLMLRSCSVCFPSIWWVQSWRNPSSATTKPAHQQDQHYYEIINFLQCFPFFLLSSSEYYWRQWYRVQWSGGIQWKYEKSLHRFIIPLKGVEHFFFFSCCYFTASGFFPTDTDTDQLNYNRMLRWISLTHTVGATDPRALSFPIFITNDLKLSEKSAPSFLCVSSHSLRRKIINSCSHASRAHRAELKKNRVATKYREEKRKTHTAPRVSYSLCS